MQTVLILGAGRSSHSLISYLLQTAKQEGWRIVVGDISFENALRRVASSPVAEAMQFDMNNRAAAAEAVQRVDVVISLLPPSWHVSVARLCLEFNKHLLTASYVSEEMMSLNEQAKSKGLLFLNECGLDPGIDHMTAMKLIHKIKEEGGRVLSFESFTGGLIAPETDPGNPWRYKFTWNPHNVVVAGQGNARYLVNGQIETIPYKELFTNTSHIHVEGHGDYEGYANRDSLSYLDTYGLGDIQTMIRGTLRYEGFCSAWNIFVQLGCCDDSYTLNDISTLTHSGFLDRFLSSATGLSVEEKVCNRFNRSSDSRELNCLRWSGFFSDEIVGLEKGTPAQVMEHILNKKWKLDSQDKDMIVMWHRFTYLLNGVKKEIKASMVVTGDNREDTAMAKTVGLPLGIAAKLLLQGRINLTGVVIPVEKQVYLPVLSELGEYGIELKEYGQEI